MDSLDKDITDQVIGRIDTKDQRFNEVMTALIRHLHDFIRDVKLTDEEWLQGIQFLTATGQKCNVVRQEFILLSDTLGATILKDSLVSQKAAGATAVSVLGPFYRDGAPNIEAGGDIAHHPHQGRCLCQGRVLGTDGNAIAGAQLDIWQAAENGLYEQQDAEQEDMNLRGRALTDDAGHYQFYTVRPPAYGIPEDGPVGVMLNKMGRHNMRPAHIHFIVSAPGYKSIVTQVFDGEDNYLESDAVFGVKTGLIGEFKRMDETGSRLDWDFVLEAE